MSERLLHKRSDTVLKMNRKKRKASGGRATNSNQKYSTVPGNDAVERGETVAMAHDGTTVGLDNDGKRTDYLQVAWLLREKLNDLVDGDKGEFPELELRSLIDMAASRNIVSVDPKMLNPVLWRTLPKELLLLVLARLPLPDITRLRCLSREWRRDMATVNSDINQACQKASPPMVAFLSHSSTDAFFVSIYDITKCRWQYAYHLHLRSPWNDDLERRHPTWTAVDACDGGLVCFVSLRKPTKRNGPLCIVVVNLLTRVQHELPPLHYRYYTLPSMVQMKVDFDTKCYKVVVAAYRGDNLIIEIYNSDTRQWIRAAASCGSIFGPVYNWTSVTARIDRLSFTTPGAYDFAEGKLELYSDNNPSTGESVIDWVLQKDHMFVLQKQTQMDASSYGCANQDFCITEYHVENETKDWVQGKSYECPFSMKQIVPFTAMCLNACDGFLMVILHHDRWRVQYFWLLDLSTCEWSKPPEVFWELQHTTRSLLCRAFWTVIS